MKKLTLLIDRAAKGLAPPDWWQRNDKNIQRLFYIKSGKGWIINESGAKTPFIPGKVYVFPGNFKHNFMTGKTNRIDHIYFDFFSTPPIVAMSPIIYDVPPGGALESLLKTFDTLLPDRLPSGNRFDGFRTHNGIPRDFSEIADAPHGSEDEFKQLIYSLLEAALTLLSYERELPFSDDKAINAALEKIHNEFGAELSVAGLAADAGFEVNYFIRRFRKVVGITPYSYLRRYRLAKARALYSSGLTLAEVAEMVGYDDPSSLSRALKTR